MSLENEFGRRGGNSDSNAMKVRIHRVREFLTNVLTQLEEDFHSYESILNDAVETARSLFALRENATVAETGLVAFWLTLQGKGLQALNIKDLISTAKEKLGRNVSAGRILCLVSKVNSHHGGFKSLQKLKSILSELYLKLLRGKIRKKLSKNVENPPEYTILMEKKIQEAIQALKNNKIAIMGQSQKVVGAVIFYILDKVVSNKLNVTSVFSAKEIADLLGVSQYTILREYKRFIDLLEQDKQAFQ